MEENRSLSWTDLFIKVILIVIFVLFTVWLLSLSNKGVTNSLDVLTNNIFAENIDRMKEVGKEYFTTERLPKKIGVKLLKNTDKVSSVCCDVVGDVCGIVSGTSGVVIVSLIIKLTDINELLVSLLVTGLISALTIGGKALGKGFAINKSKEIVTVVSKILSVFPFKN